MLIGRKITYGFMSIAVLVGLLGAFIIIRDIKMTYHIKKIEQHNLNELEGLEAISYYLQRLKSNIREFFLALNENDSRDIVHAKEVIEISVDEISRYLKVWEKGIEHGIDLAVKDERAEVYLYKDLSSKLEIFLTQTNNLLTLAKEQGHMEAFLFFEEKAEPLSREIQKSLARLKVETKIEIKEEISAVVAQGSQDIIISIIVMIIAFFSSIVMGRILSGHISGSIEKLKSATNEIGKGRFGIKLNMHTRDEIGALALNISKMAGDLKESTISRDYLDSILKNMLDLLLVLNPDMTIKTVNRNLCLVLEYDENNLTGRPVETIIDITGFKEKWLEELINYGFLANIEKNFISKSGEHIPVSISLSVTNDVRGEIEGIICIAKDMREQKAHEEALRRYERIVSSSKDHMSLIDKNYNYMAVNDSYLIAHEKRREDIVGQSVEYLLGSHFFEQLVKDKLDRCLKGETVNYQSWIDFKAAGSRYMDIYYYPYHSDNHSINGVVVVSRDITDHKKAEDQLKRKQYHLEKSQEIGRIGTWELDIVENRLVWTDEVYRIFGVDLHRELKYEDFLECVHPDDREYVDNQLRRALHNESYDTYDIEHRILVNSDAKWIREKAEFIYDAKGKLLQAIGIAQDITERKTLVEELTRRETEMRVIADNVPALFAYLDSKGCYRFVNKKYEEWFGLVKSNILGRHFRDILGEKAYDKVKDRVGEALSGSHVHFEDILAYEHSGVRWVSADYVPEFDAQNNVTGFFALINDITERKQTEENLRESEERFRKIFEEGPVGMCLTGRDYRFIKVNNMLCEMTGYSEEELLKLSFQEITHPEDLEKELPFVDKLNKGIVPHIKLQKRYIRKSGEILWVNLTAAIVRNIEGDLLYYLAMIEDISVRKKAEEKIDVLAKFPDQNPNPILRVSKDLTILYANRSSFSLLLKMYSNSEMYHIHKKLPDSWKEIVDEVLLSGYSRENEVLIEDQIYSFAIVPVSEIECVYLYGQNITERRKAEELIKASLAEKELLLKEIHHRVKNNMQVILSLIGLQANLSKDRKLTQVFMEIQQRVRSMSLVHEKLYKTEGLAKIDFYDYVVSLTNDLFVAFGIVKERIELNVDISNIFLDIDTAIPCGLIINELVTNALKYAFPDNNKGKLNISITKHSPDLYKLVIYDNGVGLSDEIDFDKIKSLGLVAVKALARQLYGDLTVNRAKGTEFVLLFRVKND